MGAGDRQGESVHDTKTNACSTLATSQEGRKWQLKTKKKVDNSRSTPEETWRFMIG